MPTVNLDGVSQSLPKWELSFTIGGKVYVTRRPTVAILQLLHVLKTCSFDDLGKLAALFEDPQPDVAAWPLEVITAFLGSFTIYVRTYFQGHSSASRIADAAAAAAPSIPKSLPN